MNNAGLQPSLEDQTTPGEQQHGDVPQLALVTLTPQNKQRLLHNAIKASEHAMETTQAIMARLEQYDPDTARLFGFKNVAISKAPLRFLCPVGRRIKVIKGLKKLFQRPVLEKGGPDLTSSSSTSDTKFDSFIGVSYCWHNEDWKPVPECQRREGWPVSLMMLNELLLRRESENEGLWIDACCIDQNNEIEKKHAIGAMDLIYKSARIVYFLLEDVQLSSQEVEALSAISGLAGKTSTAVVSQLFPRLTSSRWFTRAWCASIQSTSLTSFSKITQQVFARVRNGSRPMVLGPNRDHSRCDK